MADRAEGAAPAPDSGVEDYRAAAAMAAAGQDALADLPLSAAVAEMRSFAARMSPLWRSRLSSPEAAVERPVMRRADIVHRFEESLTVDHLTLARVSEWFAAGGNLHDGGYRIFRSAGRHGDHAFFVHDRAMWLRFCADVIRHFRSCGVREGSTIAFVGTSDDRHTLKRLADVFPAAGTLVVGLQDSLADAVERLHRGRPDVLCGFSSVLGMLAEEQLAGRLAIRPERLFANTDKADEAIRGRTREAWQLEPIEMVTATEAGQLLFECPLRRMHLNTSSVAVELRGTGLPPLITNHVNRVQPIVDYEFPLEMQRVDEHCDCGSAAPVARIRGGRSICPLALATPTGEPRSLHPIILRSALDGLQGLESYRYAQTPEGGLHVAIDGSIAPEATRHVVLQALRRAGFDDMEERVSIARMTER